MNRDMGVSEIQDCKGKGVERSDTVEELFSNLQYGTTNNNNSRNPSNVL